MNNSRKIQFTNGNTTKYVYSAEGEKQHKNKRYLVVDFADSMITISRCTTMLLIVNRLVKLCELSATKDYTKDNSK